MEGEDIFIQAEEHAAGGVAADAAVGGLEAREGAFEVIPPPLRDGVAEEYDRVLIGGDARPPGGPALGPELAEPIVAADGTGAGQAVVGGGQFPMGGGLRRRRLAPGGGDEQAGQDQNPSPTQQRVHV